MSSTWPGSTICTTLLGSRTILSLACSRHWPAALNTVSPFGKRDMISRSTKPEVAFAHADPAADVAAEHQLGHLGRSLTAEAIHQLRVRAAGEREEKRQDKRRDERQARSYPNGHCALTAVD